MNTAEKNIDLEARVFAANEQDFNKLAIEIFRFQYNQNEIYRKYCESINTVPAAIHTISEIPFLPIQFFKTHEVKSSDFHAALLFESSGTSGSINSKHFVKDPILYRKSFLKTFQHFYGHPRNYCILGLLPSYLEKGNSSLVYMVDALIKESNHPLNGFYLQDHDKLHSTLLHNELLEQPTLLIGVTYALLDFAALYPMELKHTIVMETGGMKGRRTELTRAEVHAELESHLQLQTVHSEYGMTELLSQAYSKGEGFFHCPSWMKILIREEDDPFEVSLAYDNKPLKGAINIIDLANLYSCSFIATDDIGRLYKNGSFEVEGRIDNSALRGCGLMLL